MRHRWKPENPDPDKFYGVLGDDDDPLVMAFKEDHPYWVSFPVTIETVWVPDEPRPRTPEKPRYPRPIQPGMGRRPAPLDLATMPTVAEFRAALAAARAGLPLPSPSIIESPWSDGNTAAAPTLDTLNASAKTRLPGPRPGSSADSRSGRLSGRPLRPAERYQEAWERLRELEPNNRNLTVVNPPGRVVTNGQALWMEMRLAEAQARVALPETGLVAPGFPNPGIGHNSVPGAIAVPARDTPGIGLVSTPLREIPGRWLRGTEESGGLIPGQVAARLTGMWFSSSDHFRRTFWRTVADTPELAAQFSARNIDRMRRGTAPIVPPGQEHGDLNSYVIHHGTRVVDGGNVYDMSNMTILSPRLHQAIMSPIEHFGRRRE